MIGRTASRFPDLVPTIMSVRYCGFLNRYAAIRFAHLIDGRDLSKASFRVMIYLGAIKRLNHVGKKIPDAVELLLRIKTNYVDGN